MKANEYIEKSPFDNRRIERPRQKVNDVVFLTPEEVGAVEQSILERPNTDKWKWRDMLLFRIPVVNGLRVTALSEINVDDINFADHSITVVEKGDVRKAVYVDDQTMKYLRYWYSQRKQILESENFDTDALFISSSNQRITVRSIERLITKTTAKVVPNKHITPHKLRSTLGVNMYQATKDIYLVAEVLGHRSTEPTRRYTKVFNEDKKNAVNMMADIYKNKS
jgi:site-specific recombinase XerD